MQMSLPEIMTDVLSECYSCISFDFYLSGYNYFVAFSPFLVLMGLRLILYFYLLNISIIVFN